MEAMTSAALFGPNAAIALTCLVLAILIVGIVGYRVGETMNDIASPPILDEHDTDYQLFLYLFEKYQGDKILTWWQTAMLREYGPRERPLSPASIGDPRR